MTAKRVYEAKGGLVTKNDIINSIGCTLSALAENHRGDLTVPIYRFHIKIEEVNNLTIEAKEAK